MVVMKRKTGIEIRIFRIFSTALQKHLEYAW